MRCPIRNNGYGNSQYCQESSCAWWDKCNKQCAVKTFLLNSNKNVDNIILPLGEENNDR